MTMMYWLCCVVLKNGPRISIATHSRIQVIERVKYRASGNMSEYSLRNFGVRYLFVQHLRSCDASKTPVIGHRICNVG